MTANEHTSPEVASLAGKIMAIDAPPETVVALLDKNDYIIETGVELTLGDLKTVCGSALTQARDKMLNTKPHAP